MEDHDKETCWMEGAPDDDATSERVYRVLLTAIGGLGDEPLHGGAVFAALMTLACRMFAMCSIEAGDSREVVAAHLKGSCQNFVRASIDAIEEYKNFQRDNDTSTVTKH